MDLIPGTSAVHLQIAYHMLTRENLLQRIISHCVDKGSRCHSNRRTSPSTMHGRTPSKTKYPFMQGLI